MSSSPTDPESRRTRSAPARADAPAPGSSPPPFPGEEAAEGVESAARDSRQVDFRCTNCGAAMTWDPGADALACAYCENVVRVPRGEGTILERPLEAAASVPRGLGRELRVTRCRNCGAKVSFDETSVSEVCVYCGSSSVLSQEANRNAIRPESIVPIDLTDEEARARFREWTRGLWFRPDALKRVDSVRAAGVYAPFWTFDCGVHSEWSADSGTYYYVTRHRTVMVNGKPVVQTYQEQRVRWRPAWGEREDTHDDVLVPASQGLPEASLRKLGGFDVGGLVPYRPEYLAGWRAEEYEVDLQSGWRRALSEIESIQRSRCAGDVPGDTHRDLRVRNVVHDVRWKHVLLPVWSLQYALGGKHYTVLVHGQTGRLVGDAPYSVVKILLAVLLVVVVALAFLFGGGLLGAGAAI